MSTVLKIPTTINERAALGNELFRIPATWEEYVEIVEDCEYPTEYDNREIILLSIASDPHEVIVINIGTYLHLAILDEPDMTVRGSNRHIYIPEFEKDFAPDAHIVKGKPQEYTLRKGLTANLNPWLVVEVHSPSTYSRDVKEKLPFYKKIESLRHIVYIEQDYPFVTVYNRISNSEAWENIDCHNLEDSFEVAGKPIFLKDIYRKVKFDSLSVRQFGSPPSRRVHAKSADCRTAELKTVELKRLKKHFSHR